MASGSDKRQRIKRCTMRLLDDEFNRIAAKADKAGLSFTAFLRAAGLDGDAGPRAQRRPPIDHKVLRQLLGETGRIDNNLNQIARALNSRQKLNQPGLQAALRDINDIRNGILDALGKKHGPVP